MVRRESREYCFKTLFSADFYSIQREAIAQLGQYLQSPEEDDVDESGILQVSHKVELKETDSECLQVRTASIMEKILEIDEKLSQVIVGWKTKRMGRVGLTILHLALYEMLYDDVILEKVPINEAVELAKKFGGNDSPSFVSGILTKFVVKGVRAAGDAKAAGDVRVPEEDRACEETQEPQETYAPREAPESKESEAQVGLVTSVYTVPQVTVHIRNMSTQDFVLNRISTRGEVSSCKYHTSSHIYFILKDGDAQIAAAMSVGQRKGLDFELREGQEITVSGTVDVHERDERYQLCAKEIARGRKGDLFRQFEKLWNKLEEMGMFDSYYKRPIPKYVRKVGVVMAGTGATIHDTMNMSAGRDSCVRLILYPALVQGEQAKYSIAKGIETLNRMGLDVLIVRRSGGSIEDLWAFNEEVVTRAIFSRATPVILAVGHEADATIADYMANLRAPTPLAVAELVVFDHSQFVEQVNLYRQVLEYSMERRMEKLYFRLNQCGMQLKFLGPQRQLDDRRQHLADMENRLERMLEEELGAPRHRLEDRRRHLGTQAAARLTEGKHRLILLSGRLDGLSSLKKLGDEHGFATDARGRALTFIAQAEPGDMIRINVKDGRADARVVETEPMKLPRNKRQRMPRKETDIQEKEENKASAEKNFARLEDIIKRLKAGDSTLGESSICYEAGMKLIKSLSGQTDNVEKQIQILSGGDENE